MGSIQTLTDLKRCCLNMGADQLSFLKSILTYHPDEGAFRWAVNRRGPHGKVGTIAGWLDRHGYIIVSVGPNRYFAHRLAWWFDSGIWPTQDVDHINGVRTDNRVENLRLVTRSQNNQNIASAPSHSSTKLLGAQLDRSRGCYQATISIAGKTVNLGRFPTAELAHAAYVKAKMKLHTHSDRLNTCVND